MQDPWALPPVEKLCGFGYLYKKSLFLEEPPSQGYLSYILHDQVSNQFFFSDEMWTVIFFFLR